MKVFEAFFLCGVVLLMVTRDGAYAEPCALGKYCHNIPENAKKFIKENARDLAYDALVFADPRSGANTSEKWITSHIDSVECSYPMYWGNITASTIANFAKDKSFDTIAFSRLNQASLSIFCSIRGYNAGQIVLSNRNGAYSLKMVGDVPDPAFVNTMQKWHKKGYVFILLRDMICEETCVAIKTGTGVKYGLYSDLLKNDSAFLPLKEIANKLMKCESAIEGERRK